MFALLLTKQIKEKGSYMSEQNNLFEIENNLKNFIESKQFFITDNFPRCFRREKEIIMENKASALINSILGTDKFVNFMKVDCEKWPIDQVYKLKEPILIRMSYYFKYFDIILEKIAFGLDDRTNGRSCFLNASITRCAQSYTGYGAMLEYPKFLDSPGLTDEDRYARNEYFTRFDFAVLDFLNKELYKKSLFECCRNIGACNTPQEVLLRFSCEPSAYGDFKLSSSQNSWKLGTFQNDSDVSIPSELEELTNCHPDENKESAVQQFLYRFVTGNQPQFKLNKFFEQSHSGRYKHVYSFKDEYGQINQKAITLFDFHKQEKLLIPCTSWEKAFKPKMICVPLPKEQILYNLDLLINPDIKAVILTDSIEIADQNQEKTQKQQIVWTSFLSELALVDWRPLQELNVPIYYLITNHSGRSLAEAYAKAHEVNLHLKDKIKKELKFIQCEVNFKDAKRCYFDSLPNMINYICNSTPEVVNNSVKVMATVEFEEILKKAEEYLSSPKKPFYAADPEQNLTDSSNDTVVNSSKKKLDAINYLMRPIIDKGGLCLLHAPAGLGKSSFSYSLCASIVSINNKFISGKWWTVPKGKDVPDGKDDLRKVLYLDFESGKERSDRRKKTLAEPYFPKDSSRRKKCDDNFIIKDLLGNDIKFLELANHQRILNLLKDAKKQGVKDQPVDLIVFDTLTKLVGTEHSETWNMLEPLINKIRDSGTAVLIITHSTADGKSRGFACKDDSLTAKIKLSRENGKAANLEDPILVEIEKATDTSVGIDFEPFHVQFLNKKWRVFNPTKDDLKEYGLIVEDYAKDYFRDAIIQMLGIEKSMHSDRMKLYEEKYKEKQKKK